MNRILERIKEAYHLETDAEVADFLGIKPSTLSMQKNRGRLNLQKIIAKCDDLNKNWLFDGIGPIRKNKLVDDITHIPIYSSLDVENNSVNFKKSTKAGNLLTDTLNGSYFLPPSDQVIGYTISANTTVSSLRKNDIAIINLDISFVDDGVFLLSQNKKVVFKRLREEGNTHILKSDGSDVDLSEINTSQNDQNILGKLIWVLHRTG